MARTKISELEQKFGADRKAITAFLKEKGVDVSTDSVDDNAVRLVASKFGKSRPAAAQVSKAEGTPAPGVQVRPVVKKKKKIIIITNNRKGQQGSGYVSGQGGKGVRTGQVPSTPKKQSRPSNNNGARKAASAPTVHRIVRPKTVPTQMTVDYHSPEELEAARKREEAAAAARQAAEAAAAKVAQEQNPEMTVQTAATSSAPASSQEQIPAGDNIGVQHSDAQAVSVNAAAQNAGNADAATAQETEAAAAMQAGEASLEAQKETKAQVTGAAQSALTGAVSGPEAGTVQKEVQTAEGGGQNMPASAAGETAAGMAAGTAAAASGVASEASASQPQSSAPGQATAAPGNEQTQAQGVVSQEKTPETEKSASIAGTATGTVSAAAGKDGGAAASLQNQDQQQEAADRQAKGTVPGASAVNAQADAGSNASNAKAAGGKGTEQGALRADQKTAGQETSGGQGKSRKGGNGRNGQNRNAGTASGSVAAAGAASAGTGTNNERPKPTHYDLSGNTIYTKDGAKKVVRNTNGAAAGAASSVSGGVIPKGKRPNVYRDMANSNRAARTDRSDRGQGAQAGRSGGRNGQGSGMGRGRVVMNDAAREAGRNGAGGRGGFGSGRGRSGGYNANNNAAASSNDFGNNNNRRRSNQFKDKRNRKDVAFAEDELREKKGRSGRFIKPVVEEKAEPEEQIKVITIPEKLTIGELADAMHMKSADLIKKLFLSGKMMTQNSEITYEEAEDIAADYDILCEKEQKVDAIQELLKEDEEDPKDMVPRPPVIVVMGHVDHGKTSILDYIRHTNVTKKEAGGITQAIGAYTVRTKSGRIITFLDTPGHEAFTAMRLRGAQATDIAVLVVAADDGVMPQTVEAINHAKAAGVEIIVAVNKIDKPGADPQRVRQQLTQYGLTASDWGGQTEFVDVSAKTGQGIDDLLETILLQADVMELKANPNRLARGIVLEARLDKGRGPVANVLVQKGTLHVGDFVSAGPAFGKVRALINDKGENVKDAGPSIPVMVMGLSDVPSAGEVIVAHASNDEAKSFAETYKEQHKEELVEENRMSMNVEDLFDQMREGKMKELELIVKADVQGSVEALVQSLQKLSNDEVKVKIIHSAVGNITESDVTLAEASNAAIIGFNVHPDATAKSIAEHGGVSIHLYKVIYQCIDDVDAALKGMLAPVYEEKITGHAEVRQLFHASKAGNIAGCMVLDGVIEKDASYRVTRDKEKVFEGSLASLKRFKDDVKEVKAGYDCGMVFDGWDGVNVGDQIEAYKMVEVPREEVERRKAAAANKAAKA